MRGISMFKEINDVYTYFLTREKKLGMKFGLERMHELLEHLDVSLHDLNFIHLAGTNGKGSTLNYLKNILIAEGYQVGAFISPHIERLEERMTINNEEISEADLLRLCNKVMDTVGNMEQDNMYPTQFELLTIIALMYFQEKKPDFVLMETGLGGNLDSTNVITPLISIITNVSLDHTNILGNEIHYIAQEKAGIIKENKVTITGAKDEVALAVITEYAKLRNNELFVLGEQFKVNNKQSVGNGEIFSYSFENKRLNDVKISMLGAHQVDNASLAMTAALVLQDKYGYTMSEKSLRSGLEKAIWQGRLETVSTNPHIIVDGSHNEEGVTTLMETLRTRYHDKNIVFVTAALADKDVESMMKKLETQASHIICTQFTSDRALSASELASHCSTRAYSIVTDWKEAIHQGIEMCKDDTMLVVTGSLYFLGFVRPYVKKQLEK